ncbi:hypothetical protein [Salinicoccus halodurans]|uniref:hypothetical protein n=1 Tax=Salinicoccus halodurans TaxID=407035 RepID=UPI000A93B24B|nr:hypothetical protein [Salinicoccus halodurans]
MESESDFIVVITDRNGEVVTSSNPMEPEMTAVIGHTDDDQVPDEGVILESDWADEKYVATDSPIIMDGTHSGMYSCLPTAIISKKSSAISVGNS